jgi:hypothetical protein
MTPVRIALLAAAIAASMLGGGAIGSAVFSARPATAKTSSSGGNQSRVSGRRACTVD